MRVVWLSNGMGSRVTSELVDHLFFFFFFSKLCVVSLVNSLHLMSCQGE